MKINWKVRFRNPTFWFHVAISIFIPILTHYGVNWNQMTSWDTLFGLLGRALSNPVVCVAILMSVWNCILDPTSKGVSDCARVLRQTAPRRQGAATPAPLGESAVDVDAQPLHTQLEKLIDEWESD